MKICYLANIFTIHVQRWVKYFAERGDEVHTISFEQPDIELNNINIHVVKTNKRYLFISFPHMFFQFRRIINDIKPDIVHAHYVTKYGVIGAFSGFHPIVVTAWGSDILIDANGFKKCLIMFALKNADLITCDGTNSKNTMINRGTDPKKIRIIYHGVDTQKFNSEQKDENLVKNLSISNSPNIISTRRLEPVYDIETLIKSIPIILKKIPSAKFIIAGEGKQKEYLINLAKSLNIMDSIRFIGWLAHDELPKYLASSDVYISTSLSDGGIAVSTLEAMACELPPVVTNVGDNKRWIKNGENGFVIPIKDTKALAKKIIYLLENEEIRKKFGKINRKIIEEKQNYEREMEKMKNIYIELIEGYKS